MGRTELIKRLAKKMYGNVTFKEIRECNNFCDSLVDVFREALVNGERIVWGGFLTAEIKVRSERKGRDPKTNEIRVFPPVKSVNCRISPEIKKAINGR